MTAPDYIVFYAWSACPLAALIKSFSDATKGISLIDLGSVERVISRNVPTSYKGSNVIKLGLQYALLELHAGDCFVNERWLIKPSPD